MGVVDARFRGTEVMFFSDFWVPFSMAETLGLEGMTGSRLRNRDSHWLLAAGRLRDGVTIQTATSEIEVIGNRLRTAYPATNRDTAFHVERGGQVNPGFRRQILLFFLLLLGVALMVLCTACANVANLLLARASARQKEIATRLAIGAGRGRIVRQLLAESVMLALLGGTEVRRTGWAPPLSGRSRIPLPCPSISRSRSTTVSRSSPSPFLPLPGVIFGLVPALRATRPDLVVALNRTARAIRPFAPPWIAQSSRWSPRSPSAWCC